MNAHIFYIQRSTFHGSTNTTTKHLDGESYFRRRRIASDSIIKISRSTARK